MFNVASPSARLINTGIFHDDKGILIGPSKYVTEHASRLVMSGAFSDADGAWFLAQQLESIQAQVLPVKYQDLKWRELFPVDTSTPAGADAYGYYTSDMAGQAKIINTASKDIPWSTVARGKVLQQSQWIATKFGYSYGEIEAAKYTGEPLTQAHANSARRAIEELLNTLAWDGNTAAAITGIFNNSDIVTATVPDGAGGDSEWTTKTPDEIVADINKAFTDPWVLSKEKERPDTLLLPTAQYAYISNTRLTETSQTIISYIVAQSPWVNSLNNIISVPLLTGKGTAGADVLIAYKRDPNNIKAKLLQDVTFHPVQQNGLNFETIVTAKSGGIELPYPVSFYILEGI